MAFNTCNSNRLTKSDSVNKRNALDDFDANEYELRRCLPPRLPVRPFDVYVTKKTNFPAQLQKCEKLISSGHEQIFIHGLGSAINRAINLALTIHRKHAGSMDLFTKTDSIKVTDRLTPLIDDLPPKSNKRIVSAIHIRIFRPQKPLPYNS